MGMPITGETSLYKVVQSLRELWQFSRRQGRRTLWVPASEITRQPLEEINPGDGLIVPARPFDPITGEFSFFTIAPPKSWNKGPLSAQVYWAHPATTTNFGVRWGVAAAAFGDDDALANVYAGAEVTDTGGTTHDLYKTPEFGPIDPGNVQEEGDLLAMFVRRDPGHADDNLAVDAYLIGVKLFFATNAPHDD